MSINFQQFLQRLTQFWEAQGCIIHQGYDLEVGAGTFNPATFLRSLGPEPYYAAYIEPSRRPTDGRYGTNPNRQQHYFQFQVVLKPSPLNIQHLYLQSLEALGFNLKEHDIRFVHDDWESPTLGAWGLGWEVWMDGMEVTQFTYFQAVGGVELNPIMGEITYGIERLAMYSQQVNSIFDLKWNAFLTYGDIYHRNEVEWSHYNFEKASTTMWLRHFEDFEQEAQRLIKENFPLPAYDFVLKASHAFNILDARGVISVTERTGYIARIRDLSKQVAEAYIQSRKEQNFPLLKRYPTKTASTTAPEMVPFAEDLLKIQPEDRVDFLLEIGSEELPAKFVSIGSANLEQSIRTLLEKEELAFERISSYSTPRRLSIYIHGLVKGKSSKAFEKKGPPLEQAYHNQEQLKPAGEGFFRSLNLAPPSLDAIRHNQVKGVSIRTIKGVDYLFGTIYQEERPTAAILAEHLPHVILNLEFPKKMRWADLDITYARPLKWIVSLFGHHVVPFTVGNLASNRFSYGHWQLSPERFSLETASDYLEILRQRYVIADSQAREAMINDQLDTLEKTQQVKIAAREKVILEVLNLVEWPYLTQASFESSFLKAPKEVLMSEMVEHQKYFPVLNLDQTLHNSFIITANIPITKPVIEGNQKVLSARLSDGVFLYEEDLKVSLEALNEKLKKVTFQKELGTVYEKVERLIAHTKILQQHLKISTPTKAERAARLCKADLASHMVYEFPDLQGIIGSYYAQAQKEDPEVAQAINEHWMPRGEHAPLPVTETGTLISIADKIDNLLGCFSIGLKPTSSSDPYALRRQVLGLVKILIQNQYHLPLRAYLTECSKHFPPSIIKDPKTVIDEILLFITNRIKTVFQDYGFQKDEIEASLSHKSDDIYDIFCRVKALHEFRNQASHQFSSLYEVYKRAKGQLDGHQKEGVSTEWLKEPAEKYLNMLLDEQQPAFEQALAQHHYHQAYALIATIQPALDTLFSEVKIMTDDPQLRKNRLALLQRVFGLFEEILDFSKIQNKN